MPIKPRDLLPYIEFEPDSGGTTRVYADVVKSEQFSAPALVTEHAVESGSVIADHYLVLPVTGRVVLFFSGSPIRGDLDPNVRGTRRNVPLNIPEYPSGPAVFTPGGLTNAIRNALGAGETLPKSLTALAWDTSPSRLRPALETFLKIREDRKLVAYESSLGRYEQLAFRNVEWQRGADDGDSGDITIDVCQIRFVQSDVAIALPLPLEPRGQKKTGANSAASGAPIEAEQGGILVTAGKAAGILK
jgi:hypothetical protein